MTRIVSVFFAFIVGWISINAQISLPSNITWEKLYVIYTLILLRIKVVQLFIFHNYIIQMNIFQFNLNLKIMKMYML